MKHGEPLPLGKKNHLGLLRKFYNGRGEHSKNEEAQNGNWGGDEALNIRRQ